MRIRPSLIGALCALTIGAGGAQATTFVFKGNGLNVTPLGSLETDFVQDCGTVGQDYCSTGSHEDGLSYLREGIGLNVKAYANGEAARLIQDVTPYDSGLGAFSENSASDDQTQADSNEAIEFSFTEVVTLSDVEFNAGGDVDCSNFGKEGPCGDFRLTIDDLFVGVVSAVDYLPALGAGMRFLLEPITQGAGFTVAQFEASREVPAPGSIALLLSGIAGLSFAARKKHKA